MIKSALCEMLGIQYPVFQGGMAWIADGRLAAAVSNGGGLGIIAAGNASGGRFRVRLLFVFFRLLFFDLFNAQSDQLKRSGGAAGISVFKAEVFYGLKHIVIDNDGKTGFLSRHACHQLLVFILCMGSYGLSRIEVFV